MATTAQLYVIYTVMYNFSIDYINTLELYCDYNYFITFMYKWIDMNIV